MSVVGSAEQFSIGSWNRTGTKSMTMICIAGLTLTPKSCYQFYYAFLNKKSNSTLSQTPPLKVISIWSSVGLNKV